MNTPDREGEPRSLWLAPVLTWITIVTLLAVNAGLAFAALGRFKPVVAFAVAGVQVGLVGLFFMRLDRASSLVRLTALAGGFWLVFLFVMAGADYFTRP